MPVTTPNTYTMSIKRFKTDGQRRVTTTIYENGKAIYHSTEKDPDKNLLYANNFIQAKRRGNTVNILNHLDSICRAY